MSIERAGEAFIRAEQVGRIGAALGIGGSALLAIVAIQLPIIVGSCMILALVVLLALTMPEHGFKPATRNERTTFGRIVAQFKDGLAMVRSRPALVRVLGVVFFFGLFSEAWDRLWQVHLLESFDPGIFAAITPVAFVAGLNLTQLGISVTGAEYLRRRLDTTNIPRLTGTILALTAVMVAGLLMFGIAPHLWVALAAFFAFTVSRQLIGPLLNTWTNGQITNPSVRATVISMSGQMDAIGQTLGGPPVGAIGTYSLRAAFIASATLLSPALLLLFSARRFPVKSAAESAVSAAQE